MIDQNIVLDSKKSIFEKILNYIRLINNKTLKVRVFKIPNLIRTKLQTILFYFFPSKTYLLSLKKHKLPSKDEQFTKTNNVLDEIEIFDNQLNFDEVNIFLRGFGKDFSNVMNKKNKMLINYSFLKEENLTENLHYHSERELFNPNIDCYHAGDGYEMEECMSKNISIIALQRYNYVNNKPVLSNEKLKIKSKNYDAYIKNNPKSKIIKFYFKTPCQTIRSGSGLHAALVFSKISKKVNIYGWNFYLNKSPKDFSHFKALNYLSPIKFNVIDCFFEYMVCNLMYVKRLQELKNVNIYGYLADFVKYHPKIVEKCFKTFYK